MTTPNAVQRSRVVSTVARGIKHPLRCRPTYVHRCATLCIGAAAVMTGTTWTPEAPRRSGGEGSRAAKAGDHSLPRLGGREAIQRPGDDRAGGVL